MYYLKAIALKKKPIVVINKVDKENCRPDEVHEHVFDLMFNLDATEDQLDFLLYMVLRKRLDGSGLENTY